MKSVFTIKDLILDARKALKSEAYFSALSLTFAIISECANVEYPDEWFNKNACTDKYLQENFPTHYKDGKYNCSNHDKERFQMWIDDWENDHNCNESLESQMKEYAKSKKEFRKTENGLLPIENGELLYQLRCVLFHEASNNIEFNNPQKISDCGNSKISSSNFVLTLDSYNQIKFYPQYTCSTDLSNGTSMNINVNGLIYYYLDLAEKYINDNKDKIFSKITINDNRKLNV